MRFLKRVPILTIFVFLFSCSDEQKPCLIEGGDDIPGVNLISHCTSDDSDESESDDTDDNGENSNSTSSSTVTINSVSGPADGSYVSGDLLNFDITFSEIVSVVTSDSTFPSLLFDFNGSSAGASLVSNDGLTFRFQYQVTSGDNVEELVLSGFDFSSASLQDSNNITISSSISDSYNSYPSIRIDNQDPSFSSFTAPSDGTYDYNQNLDFIITFDEVVVVSGDPYIGIDVNGSNKLATYQSGSGTAQLTFRYQTSYGNNDNDGIEYAASQIIQFNGGQIVDQVDRAAPTDFGAALSSNLPSLGNILIQGTIVSPISITNVTGPAGGSYISGDQLIFDVQYDGIISVNTSDGNIPLIEFSLDGGSVLAEYLSSDSNSIRFIYTVQSADNVESISFVEDNLSIQGNATITDQTGDLISLSVPSSETTFNNIRVDNQDPSFADSNPIIAPGNGTYALNRNLDFTITFDEVVTVSGTPYIELDIANSISSSDETRRAEYLSGSGTSSLVFRYVTIFGDAGADGIQFTSDQIELNGGSIIDQVNRTPSLDFSSVSPDLSAVLIDGSFNSSVSITDVNGPSSGSYTDGAELYFDFIFSEGITVNSSDSAVSTVEFSLISGTATATFVSHDNDTIRFSYSVSSGEDTDDLSFNGSSITLSGEASFQDSSGDYVTTGFASANINFSSVRIDNSAASISSISVPSDGTYPKEAELNFSITFNENVLVSGTPYLELDLGGIVKNASFDSGSNSSTLNFIYTVQSGDEDDDGINFNLTDIQLNSGTIQDLVSIDAETDFSSASSGVDLSNVLIDTDLPGILSISRANSNPTSADSLTFEITFSEVVGLIDQDDFAITASGVTSDPISTFSISGDQILITINNVAGDGSLRLDLDDTDESILNTIGNHLSMTNFTSGEAYTIDNTNPGDPTDINVLDWIGPNIVGHLSWDIPGSDVETVHIALGDSTTAENYISYQSSDTATTHDFDVSSLAECSTPYYAHVKVRDQVGLESNEVRSINSFFVDNTNPSPIDNIIFDGSSDLNQTPTFDWSGSTLSDNCQIDHFEVAIGYDDENTNDFDSADINNVMDWSAIGDSTTTSYQAVNGADGLNFSLSNSTDYYFSIRVVDSAGNKSDDFTSASFRHEEFEIITSLTEDLFFWLDSSDVKTLFQDTCGGTPISASGQRVGCWQDKSGNGYHVTQTTESSKPTYLYTGFNSSFPALDFEDDGSDQDLQGKVDRNSGDDISLFAVVHFESDLGSGRTILELFDGGVRSFWLHERYAGNTEFIPEHSIGQNMVASLIEEGTVHDAFENDNQIGNNINVTATTQGSDIDIYIGDDQTGGNNMDGTISEIMAFDEALSTFRRQQIEGYLACKWDIRDQLIVSHPYYNADAASDSGCPE